MSRRFHSSHLSTTQSLVQSLAQPQRRRLLQTLFGSSAVWVAPDLWAQSANQPLTASQTTDARLVVVFLRGAYDGLSALVPYSDPHYAQIRPTIALPTPDGTAETALTLDERFALHPALAPLMPLWKQGVLAAIPAAGSPDATRSHFDAQHHWEIGQPGKSSAQDGWLNKLALLRATAEHPEVAMGVGETNPQILAGAAPVELVPKGKAATRAGVMANDRTRQAVLKLYQGNDKLAQSFRQGTQSRMQTAQTLSDNELPVSDASAQEMQAANNGAGNAQGLLLDAQHLGTLMRRAPNLCLGFLSAGGWDTHANQGSTVGSLAQNLTSLAQTLVQLRKDFSRPGDVVVVVSEFGRTARENGTRGTDHGHGNAMWLMGSQVNGGRWHGRWDGLADGSLHEGRDLPVHHDFRAVFAQVLRATQGLKASELDALFPGFTWDNALNDLLHA